MKVKFSASGTTATTPRLPSWTFPDGHEHPPNPGTFGTTGAKTVTLVVFDPHGDRARHTRSMSPEADFSLKRGIAIRPLCSTVTAHLSRATMRAEGRRGRSRAVLAFVVASSA
jgi:hypothetical protein